MELKPPHYLQESFTQGVPVEASLSEGAGSLEVTLWYRWLPSYKLARKLCEGASVNVSLRKLRIRGPRGKKWSGKAEKRQYDDQVFRSLVSVAVMHMLSSKGDSTVNVEFDLKVHLLSVHLFVGIRFFGSHEEKLVRSLIGNSEEPSEAPLEQEGFYDLEIDASWGEDESKVQGILDSIVRDYPVFIVVKVDGERKLENAEISPLIAVALGMALRAHFGIDGRE